MGESSAVNLMSCMVLRCPGWRLWCAGSDGIVISFSREWGGGQPASEGNGRECSREWSGDAEKDEAGDSADSTAQSVQSGTFVTAALRNREAWMPERIFVVGHSAVTCLGRDMDSTWQGLVEGRSGVRRHAELRSEEFLQDLGGIVEDFGPGTAGGGSSDCEAIGAVPASGDGGGARGVWRCRAGPEGRMDRQDRVAVVVGSAFGGLDLLSAEQERMSHRRSLAASPYLVPGMIINQAAGQIAQQLRLYGPSAAPANACASGGHAVVIGAMFLRSGEADVAICGAGESAFTPAVINGFATMKALLGRKAGDRSEDDPGQGSRPFSRDRGGFRARGRGRGARAGDGIGRGEAGTGAAGGAAGLGDEFGRPPHGDAVPGTDRDVPGDGDRAGWAEAGSD